MAGLLNATSPTDSPNMGDTSGGAPDDQAQPGIPPRLNQPPANLQMAPPRLRKQMSLMLSMASKIVYDKKLSISLLGMIRHSGNPLAMAAQTAANLTSDLDRRFNIADGVILPAAMEILAMILDLCEEVKVLPLITPQIYQSALQGMMGALSEEYGSNMADMIDVHHQMQGAMAGPPPQGQLPVAPDPQDQQQGAQVADPPSTPPIPQNGGSLLGGAQPGAANGPSQ